MLKTDRFDRLDGVVIPGGFGERGIEGKIAAARYAREHQIPCLGLCLGLQVMVIDVARNLAGLMGRELPGGRPDDPGAGDRPDDRPAGCRRTWGARCASGPTSPSSSRVLRWLTRTAKRSSPSATVTATR